MLGWYVPRLEKTPGAGVSFTGLRNILVFFESTGQPSRAFFALLPQGVGTDSWPQGVRLGG